MVIHEFNLLAWVTWTEEGVKMKNQKKPLLIRPSRTLKTTSKTKFCFKSSSSMGASTWFLCVTFYVYLQGLCKNLQTFNKNPVKVRQN